MDASNQITRRAFLRGGAGLAAGGVLNDLLPVSRLEAASQSRRPFALPARPDLPPRTGTAPDLPPLNVIALNRLGFGPRPEDWAAYEVLGATPATRFQAYLNQQLNPGTIQDADCDARIGARHFVSLGKPLARLWSEHVLNEDYQVRSLPFVETLQATWLRALYSRRQLLEVLADFWHNHFNVYGWHDGVVGVFVQYDRDVIRANALGNFRTMLEAVATSPAMLYYLDNAYSSNAGPNENWARELFELHTMGVEHYLGSLQQAQVPGYPAQPTAYVDNDVYEAARAFTGWRVRDDAYDAEIGNTGAFFTYAAWHDRFQKTVLGQHLANDRPALEDGHTVLDLLAAHPATARHICRKLCQRLIADDPPAAVVDAAVATWTAHRAAPDQIKRTVQTILSAPEFAATWGKKVKRPYELVASVLRGTQAAVTPGDSFYWNYRQLGQPLFEWAAPDGYPDVYHAWTGTSVMLYRWNLVNYFIEGWVDGVTVDLPAQLPAGVRSANAITDWWLARLIGRPINADDRGELIQFMAQGHNPDYNLPQDQITERVPRLVELILMFPDFQWR